MHSNNPDATNERAAAREITPLPQLLRNAGLVFAGGTVGALLRQLLIALETSTESSLLITFTINLVGAFTLAFVAAQAVPTRWQLALGTGLCGGFTTYATIAVAAATDLTAQSVTALTAALATVMIGLGATALGWRIGSTQKSEHAR